MNNITNDNTVQILAFSGSTRKNSYNKKLLKTASLGAQENGASVTTLDLGNYPLPLYDEDLHHKNGFPENAIKLKKIFEAHDAFLIASPEYNGGYSAVLKNVIDWVSLPISDNDTPLKAFKGKVASILAASPGKNGGARGLSHLGEFLTNIRVKVLPKLVTVGNCHEAFNEDDTLKCSLQEQDVKEIGAQLLSKEI